MPTSAAKIIKPNTCPATTAKGKVCGHQCPYAQVGNRLIYSPTCALHFKRHASDYPEEKARYEAALREQSQARELQTLIDDLDNNGPLSQSDFYLFVTPVVRALVGEDSYYTEKQVERRRHIIDLIRENLIRQSFEINQREKNKPQPHHVRRSPLTPASSRGVLKWRPRKGPSRLPEDRPPFGGRF